MKKFFTISFVALFLFTMAGVGFAGQSAGQNKEGAGVYQHSQTDKLQYFDSHPGQPSQWTLVVPTNGENDNVIPPTPSTPAPIKASGNFNLDVTAFGGGVDADLRVTSDGITGGLSSAGGFAKGEGIGEIVTGKFFGKTFYLGTVEGNLEIIGGGVTQTGPTIDGFGTESYSHAVTGVSGDVSVFGLGYGAIYGVGLAGQQTLDFSLLAKNDGLTGGVAGQGAIGGLAGGAVVAGIGTADFDGRIDMGGWSYSTSFDNDVVNKDGMSTTSLSTFVGAGTNVISSVDYNQSGIGVSYMDGGWIAAGGVKTVTVQDAPGFGGAFASTTGGYIGSGNLGSNFNGSAVGYSATSVTTFNGMNGSINSSSSGMQVTVGSLVDR